MASSCSRFSVSDAGDQGYVPGRASLVRWVDVVVAVVIAVFSPLEAEVWNLTIPHTVGFAIPVLKPDAVSYLMAGRLLLVLVIACPFVEFVWVKRDG